MTWSSTLAEAFTVLWAARREQASEQAALRRFRERARRAVAPLGLREPQFLILTENAFLHYQHGWDEQQVFLCAARSTLGRPDGPSPSLLSRVGWLGEDTDILILGNRVAEAAAALSRIEPGVDACDDRLLVAAYEAVKTMHLADTADSDAMYDFCLWTALAVADPYSLRPGADILPAQTCIDRMMSGG